MIKVSVNKMCCIDQGMGKKAIYAKGNITMPDEDAEELISQGNADFLERIKEKAKPKKKPAEKKETKKNSTDNKIGGKKR